MARRSLREYPKLNAGAGETTDMNENEELNRLRERQKSPVVGVQTRRSRGKETNHSNNREESPVVVTPPERSRDEEPDHSDGRRKSPPVQTPPERRPIEESDHPDGQHIEENLGVYGKNFHDPCSIFLDYWQVIAVLVFIFIAVIYGYVFVFPKNETSSVLSFATEANILELLKPMTKKFMSQQRNIWYQIFTGFTNLIRSPVSPAVYLLLSDQKSVRTSSCVAEIITSVANKILPNNKKWLFLNGTKLSEAKSRDAGILVESVAANMGFSRVVVISDVQKIPGHLAAGFHFLVDQENPKIRDAVYVFTMTVEHVGGWVKPLDIVEKTLYKSWSDLGDNILQPLVTRVTEAVLHVVEEDDIGACPLKTDRTHEIIIP